jgi:hypothetical protein
MARSSRIAALPTAAIAAVAYLVAVALLCMAFLSAAEFIDRGLPLLFVGALAAFSFGFMFWRRAPGHRDGLGRGERRAAWTAGVAAALCLVLALTPSTLEDYCQYGADSEAQGAGCASHVERDYVERLDTNAARFARHQLHTCESDAGPFCVDRFVLLRFPPWW